MITDCVRGELPYKLEVQIARGNLFVPVSSSYRSKTVVYYSSAALWTAGAAIAAQIF